MLSVIAKGFFLNNPLIFFPVLALILFIVAFTAITVKALRSSDESLAHVASLPLFDDESDVTVAVQKAATESQRQ